MVKMGIGRLIAGVGAVAFGFSAAAAQDNVIVGNPQLRDFSLPVQDRIVTQPTPANPAPGQQPAPVQIAPPSPANAPPVSTPSRASPPPAAARPTSAQAAPNIRSAQPQPQQPPTPLPSAASPPAPVLAPPADSPAMPPVQPDAPVSIPADAGSPQNDTGFPWLYLLPLALLGLFGIAVMRRRLSADAAGVGPVDVAAPASRPSVTPPPPRREPGERPWLELELSATRASFTATEANLNFELEIRNSGNAAAKNLRIDVKLFNAGAEQDKEIGAFFRTAGRETTRLSLPGIPAGASGVIQGEVGLPIEQMRAVQLDGRALFIPVVAVNALYDCGDGRTGQSSKSYVVGRELQEARDKMGAFRVDQGPRVWRTIGQRPHKLARRI